MSKYKIIGLVGPSGCGKDSAAAYLKEKGYHYTKLCTTRPKRNEEDNGYFFLDSTEFLTQVLNGKMLNAQEFRGWYYGLNDEGLVEDKINILPMSNVMVEQMTEENNPNIDLEIIYIDTPNKERLKHILEREDNPDCKEICRRFLSDYEDYIENEDLIEKCYSIITNHYNDNFFTCILKGCEEITLKHWAKQIN